VIEKTEHVPLRCCGWPCDFFYLRSVPSKSNSDSVSLLSSLSLQMNFVWSDAFWTGTGTETDATLDDAGKLHQQQEEIAELRTELKVAYNTLMQVLESQPPENYEVTKLRIHELLTRPPHMVRGNGITEIFTNFMGTLVGDLLKRRSELHELHQASVQAKDQARDFAHAANTALVKLRTVLAHGTPRMKNEAGPAIRELDERLNELPAIDSLLVGAIGARCKMANFVKSLEAEDSKYRGLPVEWPRPLSPSSSPSPSPLRSSSASPDCSEGLLLASCPDRLSASPPSPWQDEQPSDAIDNMLCDESL